MQYAISFAKLTPLSVIFGQLETSTNAKEEEPRRSRPVALTKVNLSPFLMVRCLENLKNTLDHLVGVT